MVLPVSQPQKTSSALFASPALALVSLSRPAAASREAGEGCHCCYRCESLLVSRVFPLSAIRFAC